MVIAEALTNPKKHNPENFCYVVHGFANGRKEPDYFKDRYVSASLIGSLPDEYSKHLENFNIFGLWGVILNVPSDKEILAAWPSDIGSQPDDPAWISKVKRYSYPSRIRHYRELLLQNIHNEIVLKANGVHGVFVQEGSDSLEGELFSNKFKLPLVSIPKPKENELYDVATLCNSFQFGDRQYIKL